jgi:hypothetical protein
MGEHYHLGESPHQQITGSVVLVDRTIRAGGSALHGAAQTGGSALELPKWWDKGDLTVIRRVTESGKRLVTIGTSQLPNLVVPSSRQTAAGRHVWNLF